MLKYYDVQNCNSLLNLDPRDFQNINFENFQSIYVLKYRAQIKKERLRSICACVSQTV